MTKIEEVKINLDEAEPLQYVSPLPNPLYLHNIHHGEVVHIAEVNGIKVGDRYNFSMTNADMEVVGFVDDFEETDVSNYKVIVRYLENNELVYFSRVPEFRRYADPITLGS